MKKDKFTRIILAVIGILFVGTGVAFNAASALGNDPVGILYDGIRNTARLSPMQLGIASNLVNIFLALIVLIWGSRYFNIGTFIYVIPYGFVVDFGGKLYHRLFQIQTMPVQIAGAALGCTLLYTGVALYITADVGLDPFTGVVMTLKDKLKKDFRTVKICFDIGCIVLGFLLGGKLGVVTIITALSAGPMIQFLAGAAGSVMRKAELLD